MKLILKKELWRKTCNGPVRIPSCVDVASSQAEEAGTLWLFVWPQLLAHNSEITWLFSPPVRANEKFDCAKWMMGDLWGIDADGDLLIVESKRSVTHQRHDPFVHFVNHAIPTGDQIHEHWRKCLELERRFRDQHLTELCEGRLEFTSFRGLVPYSKKRMEVRRWCHLYGEHVADQIGKDYQDRVERNLVCYNKNGEPRPHYFALFTLFEKGRPALTPSGETNYFKLCGDSKVRMVAVRQDPPGVVKSCEIISFEVEPAEV